MAIRRSDHVTPLYPQNFGTKFRRQVAVAHSVESARGLRATEFVLFCFAVFCSLIIHITYALYFVIFILNFHTIVNLMEWHIYCVLDLYFGGPQLESRPGRQLP
jgi:hypothetical protein